MPPTPQDRLVRKEVALGLVREFEPPQDHIGLRLFAPFEEVQSDDVIFDYTRGLTDGMAPARAQDAESELAGKDDSLGRGSASLIDWAIKDHYDPGDVSRYFEVTQALAGGTVMPLTVASIKEGFDQKMARNTASRRKKLDNRLEWLIMTALDTGAIAYNDGKIIFNVNYGRPGGQQDMTPPTGATSWWGTANADPINDIQSIQEDAEPKGVNIDRCLISKRMWRQLYKSPKFVDALTGADPRYKVAGWGPKQAAEFIEDQTDMTFIIYDSVYRTRPLGSNTITNTRFTRPNFAIFLPSTADVESLDDAIGFGKTLTSPHPEGDWQSGFYEWEKSDVDPWGTDQGTGIKAFPVFPHLDLTYVMQVGDDD